MDSFPVGDVIVGMLERHSLSSWFGSLRVKLTITAGRGCPTGIVFTFYRLVSSAIIIHDGKIDLFKCCYAVISLTEINSLFANICFVRKKKEKIKIKEIC